MSIQACSSSDLSLFTLHLGSVGDTPTFHSLILDSCVLMCFYVLCVSMCSMCLYVSLYVFYVFFSV